MWSDEDDLSLRFLGDSSDAASDAIEAAYNVTGAIVEKIAAMEAKTLLGLIMKARAFSWCNTDGLATAEDLFGPNATSDMRIMVGVMDDLRRIKVPTT